MSTWKKLLYIAGGMSLSIVMGGAVYEHLAVVPVWTAAPPMSLSMFQGPYGLDAGAFWALIHPVTLLLLIATLVVYWKTTSRKYIWVPLLCYVLIIGMTALYFVPELINITSTPYAEKVDEALRQRADRWELLSLLRLVVLVAFTFYYFFGLTLSDRIRAENVRGIA